MKAVLRFQVGVARAAIELRYANAIRWSGTIVYHNAEELGDAVTRLLAGDALPERPRAMRVEIERPLAQVRTLRDLPPVSASRLRALVATQSGRFFRRNGKPLVTDAVWEGAPGPDRVAYAAAVEEPWVEVIAEAALASGIRLEGVSPAGLEPHVRLRLLSSGQQRRHRQDQLLSLKRLGAVAGALWIAVAGTLVGRLHVERSRIDGEIAQLEKPVAAIGDARRALDSASRMVRVLAEAESDRGRVLAALTAISAALPDSSYATAVTLDRQGRGEFTVVARRSADVLAALEREQGLDSPRLHGGVVREISGGREWERFTVAVGREVAR